MKDLRKSLRKFSKRVSQRRHVDSYAQLMNRACQAPDIYKFIQQHHLSLSVIKRSAAAIYECFDEDRKIKAGQPCVIPGYCPKLIMSNGLVNVTYVPMSSTIKSNRKRQLHDNLKLVGESNLVRRNDLSDFYDNGGSRQHALVAATDFLDSYLAKPNEYHQGMYLYGGFGHGKTFLLSAIANRLALHGVKVTLLDFPIFTVEIKNDIKRDNTWEVTKRVEQSPVLMIDDLGADNRSKWVRDNVLAVILEYRMQHRLSTFFSSNLAMNRLGKDYLAIDRSGDLEPIKVGRIMSRIEFLAKEYPMTGKDLRKRLSK